MSRAATVLAELTEETDFSIINNELLDFTSVATLQRLGYILENVIDKREQADKLYEKLQNYGKRLNYIPLSIRAFNPFPVAPM